MARVVMCTFAQQVFDNELFLFGGTAMHKRNKKSIGIILLTVLLLCFFSSIGFNSFADSLPVSGQCGQNVYFVYDKTNSTITLSGKGATYDYSWSSPSPFYGMKDVEVLVVENGITQLGYCLFYGASLKSVYIPSSVKALC